MLSIETEKKIDDLLLGIAYGEEKIDSLRQEIYSKYILNPQYIFNNIDISHRGVIDEEDIINFLNHYSIQCSPSEAKFIIYFYDNNIDGVIDYVEFLNIIISDSDYLFKKVSKKKFIKGIQDNSQVNAESIDAIVSLFANELDLIRYISELIQNIKSSDDFSLQDMFHVIKSYSFITHERYIYI